MLERAVLPALGLVLAAGGYVWATSDSSYTVSAVFPNASNLFVGSRVVEDGYTAGSVKDISVKDGKALVTLSVDREFGPLHDGAKAQVIWKAVLGERLVQITDGPSKNAALRNGAMLPGVQTEPVELDAVLSALDAPTRTKVASLVNRLQATISGREGAINNTLASAGPALQQLGNVLSDVNTDGTAINEIVTQVNATLKIIQSRDQAVRTVVSALADTSQTVAAQQQAMGQTLSALPPVLQKATSTLSRVPTTVSNALPLLKDLAPVTGQLRSTSTKLRPVLTDLRPTVAELRSTLGSLSNLLGVTPSLLTTANTTVPGLNQTFTSLNPVLDFLRPYTPEIAGWATSWGSAGGNYDNNGHYVRFHILAGLESVIPSSTAGPGVVQNFTPAPGAPVGQPWTDAAGSGMR
ncbi:MAG: MlaD family protein [Marmoricola sp.]